MLSDSNMTPDVQYTGKLNLLTDSMIMNEMEVNSYSYILHRGWPTYRKICNAITFPENGSYVQPLSPIDGLVQERRNSSALAMELRLSCTNPSIWQRKILTSNDQIEGIDIHKKSHRSWILVDMMIK